MEQRENRREGPRGYTSTAVHHPIAFLAEECVTWVPSAGGVNNLAPAGTRGRGRAGIAWYIWKKVKNKKIYFSHLSATSRLSQNVLLCIAPAVGVCMKATYAKMLFFSRIEVLSVHFYARTFLRVCSLLYVLWINYLQNYSRRFREINSDFLFLFLRKFRVRLSLEEWNTLGDILSCCRLL